MKRDGIGTNILGRPLTSEERHRSQRNYGRFCLVNGVSYMCLGENVLVLFAARLETPDAIVAILGTMLYVGFVMLPLGVRLTARLGAAVSLADFWLARNLAALLTAAAAPVALVSPRAAWGVLLLGSLLFYGCRAAGCVLGTPLVGDISTEEEAPGVLGDAQALYNASSAVMLVAITLLTARWHGLWTLAGIIVFGSCCGIWASTFLRRIRESGATRDAARVPLLPGMRAAWRNRDLRRLAAAWSTLNVCLMLTLPMSMLALKRGCGLGDAAALLCACAQFVAGYIVSRASGGLCRSRGTRRVLLWAAGGFFAVSALWLAMPGGGPAAVAVGALLFALLGSLTVLVYNAASARFLLVCPDKRDQIAGSVAINLVSGAGAGLAGSAIGPWLVARASEWAPLLKAFGGTPLATYRLYFLMLLPLFAASFATTFPMRPLEHGA